MHCALLDGIMQVCEGVSLPSGSGIWEANRMFAATGYYLLQVGNIRTEQTTTATGGVASEGKENAQAA